MICNDWTLPTAMDWTMLPAGITAKAWVDSVYKAHVLANPNDVLRNTVARWPWTINTIIHEDTGSTRNLPLPFYKTVLGAMSDTELMTLLNDEIGGDETLEYVLPAPVIWKAMLDPTYRTNLLTNATSTLAGDGYAVGNSSFVVHANTATDYHVTLPGNPLNQSQLTMTDYVKRLYDKFYNGPTTKCCASGTCQDEFPLH